MSGHQRRRLLRGGLTVAAVTLLAACAAPVPLHYPLSWSGRMVLQVEAHAGRPAQNLSVAFELSGSPASGELLLLSPLGTMVGTLIWDQRGATLRQGQTERSAATLDALLADLTGASVPSAALFEWLSGRPADVAGWSADLSGHAQGRISAQRISPAPAVQLRIALLR